MKSERRHELQHNELATWIIKSAKAVKPYQNLLVAGLVIVVVAIVAYTWWSRTAAEQIAQAWNELNTGLATMDVDKLSKVSEDYPDTRAGRTAAVFLANIRLAEGCNQRFINKALAEEDLSKAIELYESDLKENSGEFLRERSTFGLARAKESKGDLPSARQYYGEVVKTWPKGAYAAVAKQRLNDLDRPETKLMYDDFANFPKPAFSEPVNPSSSVVPPGQLPDLPAEPTAEPKTWPDGHPVGEVKPAESKKPVDNKKPVAEKKPATEKKPADSKKP